MQDCKVNILGTEYSVTFDLESKETDGESRFYNKKIQIRPEKYMLDETSSEKEKCNRLKEVVRHELFHVMLYEMGADGYARDEGLINLLAIQAPKIFNVLRELDLL